MSRLRNVETVTRSPGGAPLLKELVADRFSERVLVLRRERWMLSITHIRWCQKVLRQDHRTWTHLVEVRVGLPVIVPCKNTGADRHR